LRPDAPVKPVDLSHLLDLYARTDDPWEVGAPCCEAERIDAVARALPRPRYQAALDIGCGNGELARRIAPRCVTYTGLDAVPAALAAARRAVPGARFVRAFLPCALPEAPRGAYDLVMLSEMLYFLDRDAIADLAGRIDDGHPESDVIVVTWRGPTGHTLGGDSAFAAYVAATFRSWRTARLTDDYRIGVFRPLGGATP
jgi:SAM-dependent methyltransferase